MKKKWILPIAVGTFVIVVVVGLIVGKYHSDGYGISVGRLYFADFGTYLIDDNDSAMLVADQSENQTLFKGCENGDRVVVLHGGIAESYPSQTVGYGILRIGNGDSNFKPSDNTFPSDALGIDGAILTGEKVGFNAQYIRTDGYHEDVKYPVVRIICSADELKSYYNENKGIYNLERRKDPSSDSTIGFLDATDKYDDAYFENQILIMVLLEEGSGSNRHKVDYVKKGYDGKLYIDILSQHPEIGTCDMAEWHILIEPEKNVTVEKESDITVLLDGIDPKKVPKPVTAVKNNANISFMLFDGFEHAICDVSEGGDFWVEIWPYGRSEEKLKIGYSEGFGLCGTGLEQRKITFGQYEAYQYTYSGDKPWTYIIFENTPGTYVIHNEGAREWWDEYGSDAMGMLETLKIADGIIFKEEAVSIAKKSITSEYDRVDARYDSADGNWIVSFYKRGIARSVKLTHEGKIISTE